MILTTVLPVRIARFLVWGISRHYTKKVLRYIELMPCSFYVTAKFNLHLLPFVLPCFKLSEMPIEINLEMSLFKNFTILAVPLKQFFNVQQELDKFPCYSEEVNI